MATMVYPNNFHRVPAQSAHGIGRLVLAFLASFLFASCGGGSDDPPVVDPEPEKPIVEVGAGDMSLNREWVRATLEENREKLRKIREDLVVVRREVIRAQELGDEAALGGMREQVYVLIEAHAEDINDIQASVAEMRTVLAKDQSDR